MRELVLTPKFQRAYRKFAKRNPELQQRIEGTLLKMPNAQCPVIITLLATWLRISRFLIESFNICTSISTV